MNSVSLTPRFILPLLVLAAPVAVFAQGALLPAGAPAPMMKTLAQIESRTDVATLTGDATAIYVITQPGSYYLTADVVGVVGKGGIRIEANNVSIDLHGFTVRGPGNGSLIGIYAPGGESATYERVAIRNGFVTGWGNGGIQSGNSRSFRLEGITVAEVGGIGISLGGGVTLVEHCTVTSARGCGIMVYDPGCDARITDCVVLGINSTAAVATGIYAMGCQVTNCRVRSVSGTGAVGIDVDFRTGLVAGCDVSQITASGATTYAIGIDAPLIRDCNIANVDGTNGGSGVGIYPTYPTQIYGTRISDVSGVNAIGVYCYYAQDAFGANAVALVQSCTVTNINGTTGTMEGIFARTVLDCQVSSVQGTNAGGPASGIVAATGGIISRCTVTNVEGTGIDVANAATVTGNSVSFAGKDGSGAGIVIGNLASRVEGNRVNNCPVGYQQIVASALVIGNFAQGNTTNYSGVYAGSIVSTYAAVVAGSSVLNVSF